MKVKLIQATQNPIDVMWVAARTCYSENSPIEIWDDRFGDISDGFKHTEIYKEQATNKHWQLVKKVLGSGHSCYDEFTEVLTADGFKFWADVTNNDLIAAVNPDNLQMKYEKPVRLVSSDYEGNMYQFDNKYINLCITPNHRLYSSLISKAEDRKIENFKFYTCESMIYKCAKKSNVETALRPQKLRTCCETSSDKWYNPFALEKSKLMAFNKLIGFFIGDGYAEGGNRLEFHLKKERKVSYLKGLVNSLGWEFKEYSNDKYKVFFDEIGNFARSTYYNSNSEKQVPTELLSCSKECIKSFVDGLMNSDGSHYNKSSFTYMTTSENVANILQAAIHIIGGHASIKVQRSDNEKWKNTFKMEICIPNNRKYVLVNDSRHKEKDVTVIDYNGKIYCCEVSTGLLVVRRQNKVCLCGNSVAEHVYFTFAIEGVSRACSHQLVRHRAGIVFSQQSQRYVEVKENLDELHNLLINPVSQKEKLEEIASKYFVGVNDTNYLGYLNALREYLRATNNGVKAEDARMYLPNATKTNITMSLNFRELIHICNLRLCTRAQLEIRQLFQAIKKEVENYNSELAELLVPSCEVQGMCYEAKSCGRKPKVSEVKAAHKLLGDDTILSAEDWEQLMNAIKDPKVNEKLEKFMKEEIII